MSILVKNKKYFVTKLIGNGSTGSVFILERNGYQYAGKISKRYPEEDYLSMLEDANNYGYGYPTLSTYVEIATEIEILDNLREKIPQWHPNLNTVFDYGYCILDDDLFNKYTFLVKTEPVYIVISKLVIPLTEENFDIEKNWLKFLYDIISVYYALYKVGYSFYDTAIENYGYDSLTDKYVIIDFGGIGELIDNHLSSHSPHVYLDVILSPFTQIEEPKEVKNRNVSLLFSLIKRSLDETISFSSYQELVLYLIEYFGNSASSLKNIFI